MEQAEETIDVRARVRVSAGRVLLREGDYFGRTVNVAARIVEYARPGEVLVSGEPYERDRVEGVELRQLGPVTLKGLSGDVNLLSAARGR